MCVDEQFLLFIFKDAITKCVDIATKSQNYIEDGDAEPQIIRLLNILELILVHTKECF